MKSLCLFLIGICLLFFLAGCGGAQNSSSILSKPDSNVQKEEPLSVEEMLGEIYTDEERQQYFEHIYSLSFHHTVGDWSYRDAPESYAQLFSISFKGLPLLIYETAYHNGYIDNSRFTLDGGGTFSHFQQGICSMLRVKESSTYLSDDERNPPGSDLFLFFTEAKTSCLQTINSDLTTQEKIEQLREYGILAIPYVKKAINDGVLGYEPYFKEIGLHLTTEEYAEIVCGKVWSKSESDKMFDELRNHPKAENFDYKVWLEENKEDLDNLFTFIDAYCAEYEAEMHTEN